MALSKNRHRVLASIAAGERVHPTGHDKSALEWLRANKMVRRLWMDPNNPINVATRKGRMALEKSMPRSESPDVPGADDSVPEHALDHIRALEKLVHDQHRALHSWHRLHGAPSDDMLDLERRACSLLNLDPPGFDPATEGP